MGGGKLMENHSYNKQYYNALAAGSEKSASLIIPFICSFIQPKTVVDVGCGIGTWLHVWQQHGINDYLGIDGDHVRNYLRIDHEKFSGANLEEKIKLNGKFDLVTCLEVAEHIHAKYAATLIASLCSLGDVIVFSAAIPGQGGTGHYNEQYPQYWVELFAQNGFTGYDCLRAKIWMIDEIDGCYKQNIFFFVKDEVKEKYPAITSHTDPLLPLVHPHIFISKDDEVQSYKKILSTPFHAGWYFFKKFFRMFRKTGKQSSVN